MKKKTYYHPETFMEYIAEKNNINCVSIDLKAKRVRSNGTIRNENFDGNHLWESLETIMTYMSRPFITKLVTNLSFRSLFIAFSRIISDR